MAHLFPSTLDDLPNKWYKMEETRGDTFVWNELKENFIKDIRFIPEADKMVEATNQIKKFIQPTVQPKLTQKYNQPKASCNNIGSSKIPQFTRLRLENDHTYGKSFQ